MFFEKAFITDVSFTIGPYRNIHSSDVDNVCYLHPSIIKLHEFNVNLGCW